MKIATRRLIGDAWQYQDEAEHLFAFELQMVTGLDLAAFDSFLERPGKWRTKAARANRASLLELRADAFAAYKRGELDLAAMTVRLMFSEARHIGMHERIQPYVRSHRGLKKAREQSARGRRKTWTLQQYYDAKQRANRSRKKLAWLLKTTLPTLRKWERERKV